MLNPDYKEMLSLLLGNEVEFLLVGAYALAAHGFPGATADIDIFVKPSSQNAALVFRTLEAFGAPTHDVSVSDFVQPGTIGAYPTHGPPGHETKDLCGSRGFSPCITTS